MPISGIAVQKLAGVHRKQNFNNNDLTCISSVGENKCKRKSHFTVTDLSHTDTAFKKGHIAEHLRKKS